MPTPILIFIIISLTIVLCLIIIFIYINKYKENSGLIPLAVDFKNQRIKLLTYDKNKYKLNSFMTNQKLNNGKWISFQDFTLLFEGNSREKFNLFLKEAINKTKDSQINLSSKKYDITFSLIANSSLEEENAALLSWETIRKEKNININYENELSNIINLDNSFRILFNFREKNLYKKDLFLKFIISKLNKKFNFNIYNKHSTVFVSIGSKNKTKKLKNYFYSLLKTFENSYLNKFFYGSIFIPENFKINYFENDSDSLDYLEYLTFKENKNVFILNNSHFENNKITFFENNYKKVFGLLQKNIIKYNEKMVYEYLNKTTNIKFLYPEIDNNNYESNLVLHHTSLKYKYLDQLFNIKNIDEESTYLIQIAEHNFLYINEKQVKEFWINRFNQIKIVVVIKNAANLEAIYKKALLFKSQNIETVIGVTNINNDVIQLIQKLNSNFVVITKRMTTSLDKSKEFSGLINIINYAKDKEIKFIFEDLNMQEHGYKIRKNLNNFLYSKEID